MKLQFSGSLLSRRGVALLAIAAATLNAATALAELRPFRWTGADDPNAELNHVIEVLNRQPGIKLSSSDFLVIEDRELATSRFTMYVQTAGGIPIRSASIRTWTSPKSKGGNAVQVEAFIEDAPPSIRRLLGGRNVKNVLNALAPEAARAKAMDAIRAAVKAHDDDHQIFSIEAADMWDQGKLVRVAKVRGRRGTHTLIVSLPKAKVLSHIYKEFPKQDRPSGRDEFSIPAQVFPVYEETYEGAILQQRIATELKYLKLQATRTEKDPFESLRARRYLENMYDPILGATPAGQAQGYWSSAWLKTQGAQIVSGLPKSENSFNAGGVILEGRYATVSLHPAVAEKFKGLDFVPAPSAQLKMEWREAEVDGKTMWELIPLPSLLGKPIRGLDEAWNRPAVKDPANDPVAYINQGFDELQVYWAITALFESLQSMGFTDPELSTRPFNAFLYDPDISMADNAYYTDDTINFTTYTRGTPNMARDNPTIWHELGHGIMDRVMGDYIQLADTGGLSEGMADFLAALVLADVTRNQPFDGWQNFRIINHTGFNLTNEVHDDGEAYGGAMKDLLDAAMTSQGQGQELLGLKKVTDLTLEAMRLSRNHPALTANAWFEHMLFADQLGRDGLRAPGELRGLILAALNGRNFSMEGKTVAAFQFKNGQDEVEAGAPGARENPIRVTMNANEQKTFGLNLSLKDSDVYKFKYPVQVKVFFKSGPLQGAIDWVGEEQEPATYTIEREGQILPVDLTVNGKCDYPNREDGSCVDYAYVQLVNQGDPVKQPVAKKRFYLRIKTTE